MPTAKPTPPRPSAHRRAPGRQPGNARPAQAHPPTGPARSLVSIDEIVADLAAKQARLSALLDRADTDDLAGLAKLYSIHAQTASRLGRLLRDRRALSGQAADGIAGAIAQALDELSNELGTPL